MKEYTLTIGVKHLNHAQWERFLWQAKGGHGSGLPIEACVRKIRFNKDRIETGYAKMTGRNQGATAILDEFIHTLDESCERLSIEVSILSHAALNQLLQAVRTLTHPEAVRVSISTMFVDQDRIGVEGVRIIVEGPAIGETHALLAPLFRSPA